MPASSLGRRRSRPVADAPALDGAGLAKAWLVELVAVAPLERAARLPGPRFGEDAPRLCAAVVAALASDAAFEDLEPGGTLAPLAAGAGHLAASPGAQDAIDALECLRAVTWDALLDALDRPGSSQVADLADRLGSVIATLTTATLETPHPLGRPGDRGPLAAVLRDARPEPVHDLGAAFNPAHDEPVDVEPPVSPAPRAPAAARPAPSFDRPAPTGADERWPEADHPAPTGADERWPEVDRPAPTGADARRDTVDVHVTRPPRAPAPTGEVHTVDFGRRRTDREQPIPSAQDRRTPAGDALAQIEATLRDAAHAADPLAEAAARLRALAQTTELADPFDAAATRLRSESPPLAEPVIRRMPAVEDATEFAGARATPWAASIERRLTRHRADGLPFAVLCLELADAERLLAGEPDPEVVEAVDAAESAVLAQLRPADALIRERPGRYWLTTPDTDASDARTLALRIAGAVEDLPPHRGAPLQVAVGVVTCPVDGAETEVLERLADEALFTARAAGHRVSGPPA